MEQEKSNSGYDISLCLCFIVGSTIGCFISNKIQPERGAELLFTFISNVTAIVALFTVLIISKKYDFENKAIGTVILSSIFLGFVGLAHFISYMILPIHLGDILLSYILSVVSMGVGITLGATGNKIKNKKTRILVWINVLIIISSINLFLSHNVMSFYNREYRSSLEIITEIVIYVLAALSAYILLVIGIIGLLKRVNSLKTEQLDAPSKKEWTRENSLTLIGHIIMFLVGLIPLITWLIDSNR